MARFENGWVKFYRRAWEEDIGSNVYCLGIWMVLLSIAVWRESKIIWNGQQRVLPPGSAVFGIKELADRWECSRSVIKKWLHYLHDTGRIVLETCPRGTLATICNWEIYQSFDLEPSPPRDHCEATASPLRVHGEPLIEEVKKERKKEEIHTRSRSKFDFEPLYQKYPRKLGKQKGIAKAGRDVKSQDDFEALTRAIDKFNAYHRAKGTEDKFIPHFSTFMNSWLDWVQPDAGVVSLRSMSTEEAEALADADRVIAQMAEDRRLRHEG